MLRFSLMPPSASSERPFSRESVVPPSHSVAQAHHSPRSVSSKWLWLVYVLFAFVGCDSYCQSGPKYGTQCYSMGGPSESIALPPAAQGGVHECSPEGDKCMRSADCCNANECNGGYCLVPGYYRPR